MEYLYGVVSARSDAEVRRVRSFIIETMSRLLEDQPAEAERQRSMQSQSSSDVIAASH